MVSLSSARNRHASSGRAAPITICSVVAYNQDCLGPGIDSGIWIDWYGICREKFAGLPSVSKLPASRLSTIVDGVIGSWFLNRTKRPVP